MCWLWMMIETSLPLSRSYPRPVFSGFRQTLTGSLNQYARFISINVVPLVLVMGVFPCLSR